MAVRQQHQVVVDRDRTPGQGSGDDGAGAAGGERPIDPQPRPTPIARRRGVLQQTVERLDELGCAEPGLHVDRHHGGALQKRAGHRLGYLHSGELDRVIVGEADFGEGDHPVGDPEKVEDPEVLLGLRLPPLGRGDDEQAGIDRADAGQHVLDEANVAGYVDEGELPA